LDIVSFLVSIIKYITVINNSNYKIVAIIVSMIEAKKTERNEARKKQESNQRRKKERSKERKKKQILK
jgi:hypothetical protein